MRGGRAVIGLLALCCAAACTRGVYHAVQRGETLYRIGKAYGVPPSDLARVNHLKNPDRIVAGQRLFIPGAERSVAVPARAVRGRAGARRERAEPRFAWPLTEGRVSSRFGPRGALMHHGLDIAAPVGTTVRAAAAGTVIFSDRLRGYGKVVIIDHGGGWATVYAHNASNRAREGRTVGRGEIIATVGTTGRTAGSNLHFEVRHNNIPRDPLLLLSPRGTTLITAREG